MTLKEWKDKKDYYYGEYRFHLYCDDEEETRKYRHLWERMVNLENSFIEKEIKSLDKNNF